MVSKKLDIVKEPIFDSRDWWIEGDKAWFISGWTNQLFEYDFNTNICSLITSISSSKEAEAREYIRCFKYETKIVCLPNRGTDIIIFDLENSEFRKIIIGDFVNESQYIVGFWIIDNILYTLSAGINRIIEIDIIEEKIINMYKVVGDMDPWGTRACLCEECIFIPIGNNIIYEFSIRNKTGRIRELPQEIQGLHSITYDGSSFWLSGKTRQLFIWDRNNGIVDIFTDFPNDFGVYDFEHKKTEVCDCKRVDYDTRTFLDIVDTKDYLLCIPFHANHILIIDKKEKQSMPIVCEAENIYSIQKNILKCRFLFLYVRADRYLGVFYLKDEAILEIDVVDSSIKRRNINLSMEDMVAYANGKKNMLVDSLDFDTYIFAEMLQHGMKSISGNKKQIGKTIHEKINCF